MLGLLKSVNWINLLPDNVRHEVRSRMQYRLFRQGEFLHRKGDPATHLYELIEGKLRACNVSKEGKEFWVTQFDAGDTFGEPGLIDDRPRTHTIIAQTDSKVGLLLREDFDALCSQFNEINRALLIVNMEYLRSTNECLEDIGLLSVRERMAKLLCKLADSYGAKTTGDMTLDIEISQEGIGRMLGASRQSISKELLALRQQGIIEIRREKLIIKEFKKLRSLAHQTAN